MSFEDKIQQHLEKIKARNDIYTKIMKVIHSYISEKSVQNYILNTITDDGEIFSSKYLIHLYIYTMESGTPSPYVRGGDRNPTYEQKLDFRLSLELINRYTSLDETVTYIQDSINNMNMNIGNYHIHVGKLITFSNPSNSIYIMIRRNKDDETDVSK